MKRIITILFVLISALVNAQYNPSIHVTVNDALGVAQATPSDSRSMYFNTSTFTYRNYANRTEVLAYLNLAKYRSGRFPIYVDTAGHTGIFWFQDCTQDSCLKFIQTVGASTDSSVFATLYRLDTAKLNLRASIAGKLDNTLATGKILAGNLSNVATAVTPGGDLSMTSGGSFTVGANVITYPKIQQIPGKSVIGNPDVLSGNTRALYLKYGFLLDNDSAKVDTTLLKSIFSGASIIAENGLTKSNDTVRLGGLLTGNTTIDGDGSWFLKMPALADALIESYDTLDVKGATTIIESSNAAPNSVQIKTGAATIRLKIDNSGVITLPTLAQVAVDTTANKIQVYNPTSKVLSYMNWPSTGGGGSGTVTSFSSGNLSPLFTTSVATATTTPALSFTISNAAANTAFGNFTGSSAAPGFGKVPLAAMATGTANRLIGYDNSGNAAVVSIGSGLSLSSGTLSASGSSGASTANLDTVLALGGRLSANRSVSMGYKKWILDSANLQLKVMDSVGFQIFRNSAGNGIVQRFWPIDHGTDPDYKPFDFIVENSSDGGGLWNNPFKQGWNIGGSYNSALFGIHRSVEPSYHPGGGSFWFEQHDPELYYPDAESIRLDSWTLNMHPTVYTSTFSRYMHLHNLDIRIPSSTGFDTSMFIINYDKSNKTTNFDLLTGQYNGSGIAFAHQPGGVGGLIQVENYHSIADGVAWTNFPAYTWGNSASVMTYDANLYRLNVPNLITSDSIFANRLGTSSSGGLLVDNIYTYLRVPGQINDVIGIQAAQTINAGTSAFNTYIGYQAGRSATTVLNNIAIGTQAMQNATTGSNNTVIGVGAAQNGNFSKSIIIGDSAASNIAGILAYTGLSDFNNKLWINNRADSTPLIFGDFNTKSLGIGGLTDPSAKLNIISTTAGLLIPRMTQVQMNAISSPATGLLVWNTDSLRLFDYNGSAWHGYRKTNEGGGGGGGSDTLKLISPGSGLLSAYILSPDTLAVKTVKADNGLTLTTDTDSTNHIVLGGNLTQNTTLDGLDTYSLIFGSNSSGHKLTAFTAVAAGNITLTPVGSGNANVLNTRTTMFGGVRLGSGSELSGAQTLNTDNTWYAYIGAGGDTWTLPDRATELKRVYFIKNAGSGSVTIQRAGSDQIYDTSAVTSISIAAGASATLYAGFTYWYKL